MKYIGYTLLAIGIALFIFVAYSFITSKNKLVSPIPEEDGVRVIFISPTQ
jgi:hypothetical protein